MRSTTTLRRLWPTLALGLFVTGGGLKAAEATIGSGERAVYVAMSPCRLISNRLLGVSEVATIQVTGSHGSCTIPSAATSVVINLVGVNNSAATFLTAYPADTPTPVVASLNMPATTSHAIANMITVDLSPSGAVNIFNKNGTVQIFGDVAGYYEDHTHDDRYYTRQAVDQFVTVNGEGCAVEGVPGRIITGLDRFGTTTTNCFRGLVRVVADPVKPSAPTTPNVTPWFNSPRGVDVGPAGNLAVSDASSVTLVGADGVFRVFAPVPTGTNSFTFSLPAEVAFDVDSELYVANSGRSGIAVTSASGVVGPVTSSVAGFVDGPLANARFRDPQGVAVAADGTMYIADTGNNVIRRITPSGNVETFAGSKVGEAGSADGVSLEARFRSPTAIDIGRDGSLYVADTGNHRIRVISDGKVSTLAGSIAGYAEGAGPSAQFDGPRGLAVASDGSVFVADTGNHVIRRVSATGATSIVAGVPKAAGFAGGLGTVARFSSPQGLAVGPAGEIYVADTGNNVVRRID